MSKYRAIAGTWDSDLGQMVHMPSSCTVDESDKAPHPTGLLDASGTPLYRIPPTVRIGFHLKE